MVQALQNVFTNTIHYESEEAYSAYSEGFEPRQSRWRVV